MNNENYRSEPYIIVPDYEINITVSTPYPVDGGTAGVIAGFIQL